VEIFLQLDGKTSWTVCGQLIFLEKEKWNVYERGLNWVFPFFL